MLRITTIIFITATFAFAASKSKEHFFSIDFKTGVDNFIKTYSTGFTIVPATYSNGCNDIILEKKVKTSWNKTITLKSKTSFKNKYGQTIYQRLFLGFYQYHTPGQCSAALDSLLNCLDMNGKLKWGDSGKSLKITPTIYLINEKEIIVCKIHCEHINDFWATFKNDMLATFGNESSRIIETGCGGPIEFNKIHH